MNHSHYFLNKHSAKLPSNSRWTYTKIPALPSSRWGTKENNEAFPNTPKKRNPLYKYAVLIKPRNQLRDKRVYPVY